MTGHHPEDRSTRHVRVADSETAGLTGTTAQLAALIVNAARTRLRRRAMWRYQRAGYRPYVDHTADPGNS